MKSALILGASGAVGSHCLNLLLDSPRYEKVTALVRTPLDVSHPKLVQHPVDFDQLRKYEQVVRAQDIFCCLGSTTKKSGNQAAYYKVDFTYPYETAKIALRNGAERYALVSSVGASVSSRFFYLRLKGEIERALTLLPFKALHIFRPSLILAERKEFRLNETTAVAAAKALSFMFVGPMAKYRPLEAEDIARAMVGSFEGDSRDHKIFDVPKIRSLAQ